MSDVENERLQSLIARIEREEAAKDEIAEGIREIYAEAKSLGYDTKVMRQVVRLRKMDRQKREEEEQLRDAYMHALGDLADTDLGKAAMQRRAPEDRDLPGADDVRGIIGDDDGDGYGPHDCPGRRRGGICECGLPGGDGEKGYAPPAPAAPNPDSAAFGTEIARTATRTVSAPVSNSLDSVRAMMRAGAGT